MSFRSSVSCLLFFEILKSSPSFHPLFTFITNGLFSLATTGTSSSGSTTEVSTVLTRPHISSDVVAELSVSSGSVASTCVGDLGVVLRKSVTGEELGGAGKVAGKSSSTAANGVHGTTSPDVGTTAELVPQIGVGGVCIAVVQDDTTATPSSCGASNERVDFAGADLRSGEEGVNLVTNLIQMDRVNTIGLALGNDETCHAGQKERKGKSGRETHFDGVKISK